MLEPYDNCTLKVLNVEYEKYGSDSIIECISKEPRIIFGGFGSKTTYPKFIGNCTVWHTYPDFGNVGTLTQSFLHRVWKRAKHEHKYETLKIK